MSKVHLHANETTSTVAACGRYLGTKGRGVQAAAVQRVTCLDCRKSVLYETTMAVWKAAEKAAFEAQEPREFAEPWRDGKITCQRCGGTLFRYVGRSCYGHYDDYQCANPGCRESASRLTETGMSA